MRQGKPLIYNNQWFQKEFGGRRANVCSPLAFSILFNDDFLIRNYLEKIEGDIGVSLNQENLMLMDFFLSNGSPLYQQYVVFETNCKFAIPQAIIEDVWRDQPDRQEDCYVYMLFTVGKIGPHKQILIQTTEGFYLIDPNATHVQVYGVEEFFTQFNFKTLTNVSVFLEPMKYQFRQYSKSEFTHLI